MILRIRTIRTAGIIDKFFKVITTALTLTTETIPTIGIHHTILTVLTVREIA